MMFAERTYQKGPWRYLFILLFGSVGARSPEEVGEEIDRWCERFGPAGASPPYNRWDRLDTGAWVFDRQEDAFEFKMRWQGAEPSNPVTNST